MATTKTTAKDTTKPKKAAAPKKSVAPKVEKKPAEKKTAVKKATPKKTSTSTSPFERYKMIEVAAYYLAEKDGFKVSAVEYWVSAEKEIDKKLAKKK
jgi:hypothetical protein